MLVQTSPGTATHQAALLLLAQNSDQSPTAGWMFGAALGAEMDYRGLRSPVAFARAYWEWVYTNAPAMHLHNRTNAIYMATLTTQCRPGAYLADNLYATLARIVRQPRGRFDAAQRVVANDTYRRLSVQIDHYAPELVNTNVGLDYIAQIQECPLIHPVHPAKLCVS